ncbi:MAG: hypothetical protein MJ076_05495 [Clostridia bacterium]|nr:hypothetical protein [Clostridia bacterium]
MFSTTLSCFYLLSYCLLFSGILIIKKSKNKINLILALPVFVYSIMAFNTLVFGILNLVGIPASLLVGGIINTLSGLALILVAVIKKDFQAYEIKFNDVLAYVIFAVTVIALAVMQFKTNLSLNYITTDPSRHLRMAERIMETGKIQGLFFSGLNNGLFIYVLLGFLKGFWAYKVFVLADIIQLFLSACLFFTVARYITRKSQHTLILTVISVVYILAYPLNNMIFGFVYLGMGVNIALLIILFTGFFEDGYISRNLIKFMLMLFANAIVNCYSLFAPIVYFAVLCVLIKVYKREKKLISLSFVACGLEVFLIPCILGLYYGYFRTFGQDSTVTQAIGTEGYIYRDLYASFVIILPFVIYSFINTIKTRTLKIQHYMFILLALSIAVLFVFGMKGTVSSYYYYKLYYIMSAVCFIFTAEAVISLLNVSKTALLSYVLTWSAIGVLNFSGIDSYITKKRILMSPSTSSATYFSIYNFNLNNNKADHFEPTRVQLYEEAYNLKEKNVNVVLLDDLEPCYWYDAFTMQDTHKYYIRSYDDDYVKDFKEKIEKDVKYIVVNKKHNEVIDKIIKDYSVVYENISGKIYEIK